MTEVPIGHHNVPINEMFVSIQGEGSEVGMKATFVRFSGCNLSCDFCDTKRAQDDYVYVSIDNIVDYIRRASTGNVIFTGGEPALRMDEITDIMCILGDEYNFYIETNGTIIFDTSPFKNVTISPKGPMDFHNWKYNIWELGIENATPITNITWKYVIDRNNMDEIIHEIMFADLSNVYLMPKGVTIEEININTVLIMSKIEHTDLNIRLGLRLHILMGMR